MEEAIYHYNLAVIQYYMAKDYQSALDEARTALKLDPGYIRPLGLIEKISQGNRAPEKEDDFEIKFSLSLLKEGGLDRLCVLLLAQQGERRRAFDQVDWSSYEKLLRQNNDPVSLSRLAFIQGKPDRALRLSLEATRSVPDAGAYQFELGLSLYILEHFNEAEKHLIWALKFESIYRFEILKLLANSPERQYSSLKDYPEIQKACESNDALDLVYAVKSGFDPETLLFLLKKLSQRLQKPDDMIKLAVLYLKEVEWKYAISTFAKAVKKDPSKRLQVITILAQEDGIIPQEGREFLNVLCSSLTNPPELESAGILLAGRVPEASLKAYQKLLSKGIDTGDIHFGMGIAFYNQGNLNASKEAMSLSRSKDPSLSIDTVLWESKIACEQNLPEEAISIIESLRQTMPNNKKLIDEIDRIESLRCPVCGLILNERCASCDYEKHSYFLWNGEKLVWNKETPHIPGVILATSSSQVYSPEEPVDIIILVLGHNQEFILSLYLDKMLIQRKRLQGIGLLTHRFDRLPEGDYTVFLESNGQISMQHSFFVQQSILPRLNLVKEKIHLDGNKLVISILIKDMLRNMYDGRLVFSLRDKNATVIYQWKEKIKSGRLDKVIVLNTRFSPPIYLEIQGKRGEWCSIPLIYSPVYNIQSHPLSDFCDLSLSPDPWSGEVQIVSDKDKRLWPVILEKAVGKEAFFLAMRPFQELLISTVSLATQEIKEYRYLSVLEGRCLKIPIPSPGAYFYIGTTRHYKKPERTQDVGFQGKGFLIYNDDEQIASFKTKRKGGLINIEITSKTKVSGAIILRDKSRPYVSLKRVLMRFLYQRTGENVEPGISIFQTPLSIDEKIETLYFESKGESSQEVSFNKKNADMDIFCIVTDANTVEEHKIPVIQDVNEEEQPKIEIEQDNKQTIEEGKIYFLLAGEELKSEMLQIYPTPIILGFRMASELISRKPYGCQEKAAILYALSFQHKAVRRGMVTGSLEDIEVKINQAAVDLIRDSERFPDGRWGEFPGEEPDPELTIAILHHLSPYIAMPKFKEPQQLAILTLKGCREWGIRDNRLIYLDTEFSEQRIKSPEAAAGEIIYGSITGKGYKYLEKSSRTKEDEIFWTGKSLGGTQETTSVVARALIRTKNPLFYGALRFLARSLKGLMFHSFSATAVFLDLLEDMDWDLPLLAVDGQEKKVQDVLTGKTVEVKTEKAIVRAVVREEKNKTFKEKSSLSLKTPKRLRLGDSFKLILPRPKNCRAPIATVHIPDILRPLHANSPVSLMLHGKKNILEIFAIKPGSADIHVNIQDRYKPDFLITGRKTITVV